jgi:hypothetical protein
MTALDQLAVTRELDKLEGKVEASLPLYRKLVQARTDRVRNWSRETTAAFYATTALHDDFKGELYLSRRDGTVHRSTINAAEDVIASTATLTKAHRNSK